MTTTAVPARLTRLPVWVVSVLAGLAAAVATELYGLAARGVGIPMRAGSLGATEAGPISLGMFALGTFTSVFWGTILAVILARFASRPARTYLWTTVALTALSLVPPLAAPATAWSTKIMLAVAHIVAAAIVIPLVTRRLSHVTRRR